MVTGMAILNDFDRKIYDPMPAKKQKLAVRVPEGNMAHAQARPTTKKNILSFLILVVMPKMINATDVAAIATPKLAASLNMEK